MIGQNGIVTKTPIDNDPNVNYYKFYIRCDVEFMLNIYIQPALTFK